MNSEAFSECMRMRDLAMTLYHYFESAANALDRTYPMVVTEIHVDEYICPNCGTENLCDQGVVTDHFCPYCGQALKVEKHENQSY